MTGPRPVRLLVFCGATRWGGAEILLGHLLAALPERFETSLLGVDAAVLTRIAARRPGTAWTTVPRVASMRDLPAIWAHRRAMAKARPDVLHLNLPVPFSDPYSVLAALTLRRTPVIAVEHLPMPTRFPRTERIVRATAPHLSAIVGVSESAARQIERLVDLQPGAVRVIPNGVPKPKELSPISTPRGGPVVGAVGRFDHQKGFDLLLSAVAELPGVHLVLVGDGPERPALEQLVADLRLGPRVSLLGWSDDASGYLRSFDVLAMPSRYEGLPLTLLEAMRSGVAIVATRVGGIPDAVEDGESALLIPPDDVAALTAALRRLTEDPVLRRCLGAAAQRDGGHRFTVEKMARTYEALYDDVLSTRSSPR